MKRNGNSDGEYSFPESNFPKMLQDGVSILGEFFSERSKSFLKEDNPLPVYFRFTD